MSVGHGVDVQDAQPASLQLELHLPVLALAVHVEPVRVRGPRHACEREPEPESFPPVSPLNDAFSTSIWSSIQARGRCRRRPWCRRGARIHVRIDTISSAAAACAAQSASFGCSRIHPCRRSTSGRSTVSWRRCCGLGSRAVRSDVGANLAACATWCGPATRTPAAPRARRKRCGLKGECLPRQGVRRRVSKATAPTSGPRSVAVRCRGDHTVGGRRRALVRAPRSAGRHGAARGLPGRSPRLLLSRGGHARLHRPVATCATTGRTSPDGG